MKREIETLSSKTVYENKWMRVKEDGILFPSGHGGIYGYVDKPDFALIVPIHGDGSIQLVEQYRYPVQQRLWELPLGVWEGQIEADPVQAAHGELAEETGLRAGKMEPLGDIYVAAGLIKQSCHMFVATELTEGPVRREVEEQGMITAAFSPRTIFDMIQNGAIRDAATMAALGYLQMLGRFTL